MTSLAPRSLHFTVTPPGSQLLPGESIEAGWQRVTATLLKHARRDLGSPSIDEGVHEARKRLKRTRAMLRMARPALGSRRYHVLNGEARDIGRSLSAARDAWVLVETLSGIADRYDDVVDETIFAPTERYLLARRAVALRDLHASRKDASKALKSLRREIAHTPLHGLDGTFAGIAPGIERVYRRGRQAMAHARGRDTLELHEWRKQVKYLRYLMEALRQIHPVLMGVQAHELDVLGELLGLDHDLAVLSELVLGDHAAAPDRRVAWLVAALGHEWRSDLQTQALRAGTTLYTEKPKAFTKRLAGYWIAARM